MRIKFVCSSLCLLLFPFLLDPAIVTDLSIKTTTTTSLSFHWSPPMGDFEFYEVFLYRNDDLLQEKHPIQSSSQQCLFQGLQPGALYRMVILIHSGDQTNQTSIWARTGKTSQIFKSCMTGDSGLDLKNVSENVVHFSASCSGISEGSKWKPLRCSVG